MIPQMLRYRLHPTQENIDEIIKYCSKPVSKKETWVIEDGNCYNHEWIKDKKFRDMVDNRTKYNMSVIITSHENNWITADWWTVFDYIFVSYMTNFGKKDFYRKFYSVNASNDMTYDVFNDMILKFFDTHKKMVIDNTQKTELIDRVYYNNTINDMIFPKIGSKKIWKVADKDVFLMRYHVDSEALYDKLIHPDAKILSKTLMKSRDKAYFRHNLSVVKQYFDIKLKFYY
jgi:hypothetical protein